MGKQLLTTGIEELELTVRTYTSLKRSGVHTVGQLLALRKQELLSIGYLTPRRIDEIRDRLIACQFLDPAHLLGPFTQDEEEESF
jgi:DNA-directed RNA polymerase subunit alpha